MILLASIKPEYLVIIGVSVVIILSSVFNYLSKKTNVPSVLMLMILGVILQFIAPQLKGNPMISKALIIVGKVGLILIVLEAALDLKLQKDKIKLITTSFFMSLLGLLGSSFLIAFIIQYFLGSNFFSSFVYAVPLSIMSSAIIIPSVTTLKESKREFMIYESTFSDILGIILFQFLVSSENFYTTKDIVLSVSGNIVLTIFVAVVFSYITVWGMQKLTSHVKLFLIIAILMLVYALSSVFHLSALIIVLFFGLILNNTDVFFRGFLKETINPNKIDDIFKEFYIITLESAFVLRTFFFVMFGLTISLISLVNFSVALQSLAILIALYAVRFVFLKVLLWNKTIMPELFIAPRGLITVLLFYTIPGQYSIGNFDSGVLLYTILFSSLIMMVVLVVGKGKNLKDVIHNYDDLQGSIGISLEGGRHGALENNLDATDEVDHTGRSKNHRYE